MKPPVHIAYAYMDLTGPFNLPADNTTTRKIFTEPCFFLPITALR